MILIALLLVIEGLSTGLWIAKVVPVIGSFGAIAIGLALLRGLVGAAELAGGVFLIGGRRSAVSLSRTALLSSALLTTLEIGARLTPNNLVPSWRWPLVIAYWLYALGASAYLGYEREVRGDKNWEVQETKDSEVREDKSLEVREEKNAEVMERKHSEVSSVPTGDPTESGERPRLFE